MLKKLLKYDLKSLFKSHLLMYIVLICLAVITKVLNIVVTDFPIINTVQVFSNILLVLMIIASFAGTFVISIMRFYNNLIKDEGYLTHTLPVKKSDLILSKLISANLFSTITSVICCIVPLLVYGNGNLLSTIGQMFEQLGVFYNLSPVVIIIVLALSYIIGNICQFLVIYLGIALGQLYTKKILYSVVYTILIYTIVQIVTTVILLILSFIFPNIMDVLNSEIPPKEYMYAIFGFTNVLNIIIIVVLYYLTTNIFTKKLNID